jgi:hypothetical protein
MAVASKKERERIMILERAVEPQKAHRTQRNQEFVLVKYFTRPMSIFPLSTSCFFYVIFVPYVAICCF